MHLKPLQVRNVHSTLFFSASDSLMSLPKFFGSYPIVRAYSGHSDMSDSFVTPQTVALQAPLSMGFSQ